MKPVAPNTLIQNRYLIVHLIGKGGMGEVYLSVDQRLGSAVALKRTFFSDDATLGNAFEREAKTLARLRHPALPKVSDHFTEEGTQYLVMEHISGDDISKRLEATDKPFPLNWVLFWADQLLDALTYLHSHEPPIIHRDIKPQNLKLTDENHIVLLDFGLSKNSLGETRVTTTGSIVGYTPHYAPMEQIRGTGTDARSDLYSLSATLYQIMTNVVPPDALSRADSLINGMPDPVKPISELNPEVSKAISDVIVKGMAISQEQRYKTAREMQKALRDAYTQLQSGMSANTVAFTTESQPEILQSQQKTEVLSGVPSISPPPAGIPAAPVNSGSLASQSKADVVSARAITETGKNVEPNFDATLRYDSDENAAKQSDIKTEVLLAGSTPAITAAQNGNFGRAEESVAPIEPETGGRTENFEQSEFFKFDENLETPKNFSPDATTPLISFDSQNRGAAKDQTATSFDSLSGREENRANDGATFVPTENVRAREETFKPAPVAPKKSSGKGLAIGGGIAALLLLVVAAAGIGWFFMRDGGTTENITPTPTAFPTATIEPTVAPIYDVAGETNSSTNSTNSETNSDAANTETNSSTGGNVTIGTQTTPNRQQQQTQNTPLPIRTPTPRPNQQVTTVKTPQPPKTPVPTSTTKKTKTDIEQ